ncbi:MAG: hypothetical protein EAZ17_01175 [Sphingobacteriales bacterium]|nr:MAG: hypothetical protein EAZ17_01175 [Sphingobacteriales bacterium]
MERKRIFDFTQLKRVFHYAAPYKNRFVLSIVLAIVLAVLAPVRPILIQHTINNIIAKGLVNALVWITVIQIGILIVETVLRFVFSFITTWLGQTVVKDLRVEVFGKIIRLNLSQFDKTPIGTLTTRTINDIESINDIFSEGLIPLVADFLSIIAILIAMFWTNWQLTLVCLIPFPILMVATYYFKESVNKSFIRVRNAVAALNAFVQEHITGMAIVQSFAVEDKEASKFREINKEHRNANVNAIFAYSVFFPIVEIILATSMGLLVWYAGVQDALVQWWYGHNAVAFFLTTPILGLMYYFMPKAANRPVYSYRLSIIHFWALIFIYIWAGPHHLLYTALPDWAQSLGTVFSIMLILPSWGGMLNGLFTLQSRDVLSLIV